jgi:hypothetical protein
MRARQPGPSPNPGEVMKSTRSRKRCFSWGMMTTNRFERLAMSLPPPDPGSRTFGRPPVAHVVGVEISVAVDLGAADEAHVHQALLEQPHDLARARGPDRARQIRRIAHGHEGRGAGGRG